MWLSRRFLRPTTATIAVAKCPSPYGRQLGPDTPGMYNDTAATHFLLCSDNTPGGQPVESGRKETPRINSMCLPHQLFRLKSPTSEKFPGEIDRDQ